MRIDLDDVWNDPIYSDAKVLSFTPKNAYKYFGVDFVNKVTGEDRNVIETWYTKNSEFKWGASCGRCSNCSEFECGLIHVNIELFMIINDNVFLI